MSGGRGRGQRGGKKRREARQTHQDVRLVGVEVVAQGRIENLTKAEYGGRSVGCMGSFSLPN